MASYRRFEDHFLIGPQPMERDLKEAKQQGIQTVIDLRMPSQTAMSKFVQKVSPRLVEHRKTASMW